MSTFFANRHVLEDRLTGFEPSANDNHLAVLRRPVMFSALAHAGREMAVAEALALVEDVTVRCVGPQEWLLVSQTATAETITRDLAAIEGLSFVEQSDGQVLLMLKGPDARKILAKCVAVDLHADVFEDAQSASMLIGRVAGNLARIGADAFEIIVPRSYAGFVFDELREAGREYAMTRDFAD